MSYLITILLMANTYLWLGLGILPLAVFGLALQIVWMLISIRGGI